MTIKIADILYHARKKPIDHAGSSILFAHLSKEVKEELLRLALSTLMNRALLNAETKDFYVILADVRTPDYPNGYYGTIQPKGARTPITITEQSGNDLTDYAVKIELDDTWDGWDAVIDGSDIYFLDENGNPLYYWIEKFDKADKHAIIWVKIPFLPANSSIIIYMHYGGDNPFSAYHDPSQVFLFFDDFSSDTSANYEVASAHRGGVAPSFTIDTVKSEMIISLPTDGNGFVLTPVNISELNIIIEAKGRLATLGGNKQIGLGFHGSSTEDVIGRRNDYTDRDELVVGTPSGWTILSSKSAVIDSEYHVLALAWLGDGTLKYFVDYELVITATHTPVDTDYRLGFFIAFDSGTENVWDWIRIRKYIDPEPSVSISASEFTGIETTNLEFPDGIDKILVTIDSDAQEAYYSIDGGQTWNALTLDEEILLPETATQLKLKFANLSYFRGYALIGW